MYVYCIYICAYIYIYIYIYLNIYIYTYKDAKSNSKRVVHWTCSMFFQVRNCGFSIPRRKLASSRLLPQRPPSGLRPEISWSLCQTQKDRKVNWCELYVFLKDVTDVTFSFWGFLNIVASNKHMEISAYKIAQIYSSWAMCSTASAIFCPRIKKIPSQSCVTQLSDSICPSNWK